ncbi:PIN domain-containing protein [Mesorhizobium sp. M9A.F.Ca.ET.002.03.1.2]|uniref:PIN domain-containing protein n=1 Tax=Mesorhizobium sp. M9A.F.Ca.ET.002.03.1.2 TaxID=2493668 RepID=UPI000F74E7BB|nr:PIN domain-containing protein [Mesorhizobium sp. M9A.F.Ca.ET.002.03.1.2]AZN96972.1 PIN domain-containing protein [Mesorhizobium sp. M9A.F.Ca.ET.002.03.1.2]
MPNARIECFLDSNVLLYAASERTRDPHRHDIAQGLVLGTVFGVSGQTLAEFANVARRKSVSAYAVIDQWLVFLGALPFVPVDQAYVVAGLRLARRYQLKYYDAALLAAAERLGAPVFYTEDLNHNQLYGSVRAINPFL